MKVRRKGMFKRLTVLLIVFIMALPAAMVYGATGEGFDSEGRMIATYGSPVLEEGNIDSEWDKAPAVVPPIVVAIAPGGRNTDTTATFKVMWDEQNLYVLAIVTDKHLDKSNANTYEQDSIEVFMDENNDKTRAYGSDDVHYRVNFENLRTADDGDINRFNTVSHVTDTGYVNQIRIPWLSDAEAGKVVGFDLQVNETNDSGFRQATLNVFDDSGNAWQNTTMFGELILAAEVVEEAPVEANKDELEAELNAAKAIDPNDYENGDELAAPIAAAESVVSDEDATQDEVDGALADLKAAVQGLEEKVEVVVTVDGPKDIARADFLVVLVNTLGINSEFTDNFDDVAEGTFYYEAVGIAKQIGLVQGVGNNNYNPESSISTQDIMVLTVRALERFHGVEKTDDTSVLDRFSDKDDISDYAVDSVATLEREGLLQGIGSTLDPRGNSNWGQALELVYHISQMFNE